MLLLVAGVLALLWMVGLIGDLGGNLIHLLLVVALVVFIVQFVSGRRSGV